jgi:excisionase family DNA binding protein
VTVNPLLSVEEAARQLGGLSKWTIHAWLSQGRLQRTKVGGRTMIRTSELQKVIEEGGKSPTPRRSASPTTKELASKSAAQNHAPASGGGAGATDTHLSLLRRRRRGQP